MISKKAMMVGQIFIFVLSMFIVLFILIYGYRVINNFIGTSSGVEMLQFRKNMENYVKSFSTEFGSVGYRTLSAPGDVKQLCFTDYYNPVTSLTNCDGSGQSNIHPVIDDSHKGVANIRQMKNLFLIDVKGNVIESDFMGNITVRSSDPDVFYCNYLCIDSFRGQFNLKIQGMGVGVQISDATP
jgi:hypothetical protein